MYRKTITNAATDEEGVFYAGGYFGPDPVVISPEGELLCKTTAGNDDIFWLYEIIPSELGCTALYESGSNG